MFFIRIKEFFNYIKPFNLPKLEEVDAKTIEICQKFNEKYKEKCVNSIVKDQRYVVLFATKLDINYTEL